MGKLLDLAKALAGERSLHGRVGRWILAASAIIDGLGAAETELRDTWSCPANVAVNDAVYVSGADAVDLADATAGGTAFPVIGFVVSKPTATTAVVQYGGLLPNTFVGLVPGGVYYLSETPGQIEPAGIIHPPGTIIQQVGVAKNATTLLVVILEAV